MKAKTLLSILALFCLIVSCQTSAFTYNNDIFTKSTDSQYQTRKAKPVQTQSEKENLYYDDYLVEEEEFYDDVSGTANVILVAVDDFDAYDYFWTARLRRFHTHVSYGWGFYDPFYTNMFWYTNSPSMWGVSIYLGYNWWWPSPFYRPWYFDYGWHNWGWSYGWGWGWHRPWRFGGPWGGWSDGFNAGFWAGYYHNRFDRNNSFFYGHRNTIGGPSTGRGSTRRIIGANDDDNSIRRTSRSVTGDNFNQRYETISRSEGTGRGETGTVTRNDVSSERGATTTRQTETRTTTTPTTRQTETRTTTPTTPSTRQTETRTTTTPTTPSTRQTETRTTTTPTTPSTRQTETRTTTTPTTPSTRQTETRPSAPPSTPSTRQDTYNSGFRPDNSRNTPTHTPPSSRNSGSSFSSPSSSGSGFSSPSSGGSRSSGSSSPSGGSSSGGSRSSGGSSGNTRR